MPTQTLITNPLITKTLPKSKIKKITKDKLINNINKAIYSFVDEYNFAPDIKTIFINTKTGKVEIPYDIDDDFYDDYGVTNIIGCSFSGDFKLTKTKPIKTNPFRTNRKWGIEIECLVDNKKTYLPKDHISFHEFVVGKTAKSKKTFVHIPPIVLDNFSVTGDGSIETDYSSQSPIEFVSQIFSGYTGIRAIKSLFETFKPKFNDTCGIHVHASHKLIENNKLKFSVLVPLLELFIFRSMVAKNRIDDNQYVALTVESTSEIHSYMNFIYSNCGTANTTFGPRYMRDHMTAVNFSPRYQTVEFRYLHGTDDIKLLTTMIKYYLQTINVIENLSLAELKKFVKSVLPNNKLTIDTCKDAYNGDETPDTKRIRSAAIRFLAQNGTDKK